MSDLITAHLKACKGAGLSPNTRAIREWLLHHLDEALPRGLEKALPHELADWLGSGDWASPTRETYWCHIVGFYRWCVKGRYPQLDYDPSAELPRPRVGRRLPRVATDEQLAHALAHLDRPALRCVILAAGAGMRACEVARAERGHFGDGVVRIHGKGDSVRVVPVPPDVWAEVAPCAGRLVTRRSGEPVNAHWVSNYVGRNLDEIGLPDVSLHWFRGSYATRLRRSGADAFVISRLLGHASVATTERYVAVQANDLAAAVRALPPLGTPASS